MPKILHNWDSNLVKRLAAVSKTREPQFVSHRVQDCFIPIRIKRLEGKSLEMASYRFWMLVSFKDLTNGHSQHEWKTLLLITRFSNPPRTSAKGNGVCAHILETEGYRGITPQKRLRLSF